MNYLAHLYFSDLTPNSCVGQLLPDCMPLRRLPPDAPDELVYFARLHQHIDHTTDHHPAVVALRETFEPPYRRFAGVLVDVFFDHALARQWEQYHDQSLARFAERAYAALAAYEGPENTRLHKLRHYMVERRWFLEYANRTGMHGALNSLDRRSRFNTPLGHASILLDTHGSRIFATFEEFFPDLERAVTLFRQTQPLNGDSSPPPQADDRAPDATRQS